MAKAQPNDLTVAYNQKVLAAIKTIGQGLMDLADALVAPSASAERPETRPAASRTPAAGKPPAEDTSEELEDDEVEVKLADLQTLAKDLIKKGGRPKLLKILETHDLENVSSAPVAVWKTLKKELEEASE